MWSSAPICRMKGRSQQFCATERQAQRREPRRAAPFFALEQLYLIPARRALKNSYRRVSISSSCPA